MSTGVGVALRAAVMLLCGLSAVHAAHVYAVSGDPFDPGLKIYKVRLDGSLVYTGKTAGPGNNQLVATPGGRYIYQFDGRWINQFDVMDDGTLRQTQSQVTYPDETPYAYIKGMAMHPSGDYLFVLGGAWIYTFRTDDIDGHLTLLDSVPCAQCTGFAMERAGQFLFAAGNSDQPEPGPMRMIATYRFDAATQTVRDAGGRWYGPGLDQTPLRADDRYVFATTWDGGSSYVMHALAIAPDGSLHETATGDGAQFYCLASIGGYVAASPSGRGSKVTVYTIANGKFVETDEKPIEVMYSLTQGTGSRASLLWVTTDDGIASYTMGTGGRLTRTGKVMIPFANPVYFVNK